MRPADPAPTTTTSVSAYVIMSVMYRRVISRDTIDSLIGSNLNDRRSYGGGDEADIETEKFCEPALAGRGRLRAGRTAPWAEESRKAGLDLEECERVRVEVMVAMDEI